MAAGGAWSWTLIADGLGSLVLGVLLYFAPDGVLGSSLQPAGDGVQWHIGRCIGAQLVHAGVASLTAGLSSGRDEVRTSMHMTKVVYCALLLMVTLHTRLHVSGGESLFLGDTAVLVTFTCVVLIVAHAWGLVCTRMHMGERRAEQSVTGTLLLNADTMAAKIIGAGWLIFPDWILQRQVSVPLSLPHVYLGRFMGAWFMASSVASGHMHYYSSAGDRRAFVAHRALMCAGIFGAQLWSQHAYHEHWAGRHWVGICLFSLWTFAALFFALSAHSRQQGKPKKSN